MQRSSWPALVTVLATIGALANVSCQSGVAIVVGDHSGTRLADGRVQIDLEVIGAEQGGRSVGPYCASVHWFNFGTNFDLVPKALTYAASIDRVVACSDGHDLGDGDHRVFRLVSTRTDIPVNAPMRLQASAGDEIDAKETGSP